MLGNRVSKHLVCMVTVLVTVMAGSSMPTSSVDADEPTAAMDVIFGREWLQESAFSICQNAAKLSDEDRYDFLADWVLPGPRHGRLRMPVCFSPTDPAPPVRNAAIGAGRLISPAIDLIEVAEELGKLESVLSRLQQTQPIDGLDAKSRHALLAVILSRMDRIDEAVAHINSVKTLSAGQQVSTAETRAAEAVLSLVTSETPDVHAIVVELIRGIAHAQRVSNVWTPWDKQFKTLAADTGALNEDPEDGAPDTTTEASSTHATNGQWVSVSAPTAETRGTGIPASNWKMVPGLAENIVSHGGDYLYFQSPLRGSFQAECDFTSFGWTDTQFLVGGVWVDPTYTHEHFDVGDIRDVKKRHDLTPQLTKIRDKLHYRTTLKEDVVSTYVNGRELWSQELTKDHDPWVAIRSDFKNEGTAWDVRVTGTPEIPESIRLSASAKLEGWRSYSARTVGWSHSHWQQLYVGDRPGGPPDPEGPDGGGIFGRREVASPVTSDAVILPGPMRVASGQRIGMDADRYAEEALFYHRPMLEDGTIEYEFFYQPGLMMAHPAIDRLCLLMHPDGVKVHWLTDGIHDRTSLSPANQTVEPGNQRGPGVLPLIENDWNRVTVALDGNAISLTLNSVLIYQHTLDASNHRRFGFFHFADQHELRVRNVVWTGDWPMQLPEVADQKLASKEYDFLHNDAAHLTESMSHDFTKDGLPEESFTIVDGARGINVVAGPDGIRIDRPGVKGFRNATVAPRLAIHGDFDVTARYEGFLADPQPGGSGSAFLVANMESGDHVFVTRRHMQHKGSPKEQITQCVIVQKKPIGERREYFVTVPTEQTSGALRLVRRGSTVFYLAAEADSPNFRVLATREFSDQPIPPDGLRMVVQSHQQGSDIELTWKSISIRAEKIGGAASGELDQRIADLNTTRTKLQDHHKFDFASVSTVAPSTTALFQWGSRIPQVAKDKGLRISAPGYDSWQSSGIAPLQTIVGDFDVTAEVDVLNMDKPRPDDQTALFLQLQLMNEDQTQVSAMLNKSDSGYTRALAQMRTVDPNGGYKYENQGGVAADKVDRLRIARRGSLFTIMARIAGEQHERILAVKDVSDVPLRAAQVLLHTGGTNRQSEIVLKSLEIHADEYTPELEAEAVPVVPPEPKKGVLDSVLELFK